MLSVYLNKAIKGVYHCFLKTTCHEACSDVLMYGSPFEIHLVVGIIDATIYCTTYILNNNNKRLEAINLAIRFSAQCRYLLNAFLF